MASEICKTLCVTYMGLESYLFNIKFRTALFWASSIDILEKSGMTYLKDKSNAPERTTYGNFFFELRSDRGLIECHIITPPGKLMIEEFSLRFSILSPASVIDETFSFFQRLNDKNAIEIYDTEIRNHIFRQLRKDGKVNQNFEGLNDVTDEAIDKLCIISLNADEFKQNPQQIAKRQAILHNQSGEIIKSGEETTAFIEKRGLFDRVFGWLKKEL